MVSCPAAGFKAARGEFSAMNRSLYEKTSLNARTGALLLLAGALALCLQPDSSGFPRLQEETAEEPREQAPAQEKPKAPAGPLLSIQTINGSTTLGLKEEALKFSPGENGAGILAAGSGTYRSENILFLNFEHPAGPAGKSSPGESSEVVLSNGDHFWGTPHAIEPVQDEEFLAVKNSYLTQELQQKKGQVRFNLSTLRLLLFRHAFSDEAQWTRFRGNLLSKRPKNDVAHLSAGTRLTGFLENIKPGSISFSADGVGQVKLPTAKIRALNLAELGEDTERKEELPAGQQVGVFLADGGNLHGGLLSLTKAGLSLRHELLGTIGIPIQELSHISFLGGRCQYLSDIEPKKTTEHLGNLFLAKLPFKKDRNVLGKQLRIKGKTYPKGLGVHAYSKLEYDLAGGFQKFQATIGLDDSARPPLQGAGTGTGAVVFRVWLDGKKITEKSMKFSDPPQELDLSVANGQTLAIEVDFGDKNLSAALDRANWCGARLIR